MTSLANAKRMKYFIKALFLTGLFLVLVTPLFVSGADEATAAEAMGQNVLTIAVENIDQVIGASSSDMVSVPTGIVIATSTNLGVGETVASSSEDIIASSTLVVATSLTPVIVGAVFSAQGSSESTTDNKISKASMGEADNLNKDIAISDEFSGNSIGNSSGTTTDEGSFTTIGSNGTSTVISSELSFTTSNPGGGDRVEVVSEELSFTTSNPGGGDRVEVVSEELSFTTGVFNGVISDEVSFTTNPGSGGCVSGCGGGGGGGGTIIPPPVITLPPCQPYLLQYIKFGANNDPYEVRKLQAFLIVFEKETGLGVTGYYDRATFEAVERFQKKYSRDVLGPWGITDSTGYVFITTRIAINNVYCGRDTTNNMDLRNYYGQIENLINPRPTVIATSTATTTASSVGGLVFESTSTPKGIKLLQMAFIGLLDFLREIPCWLWNLILLLLIILLLLVIWYLSEEDDDEGDDEYTDSSETISSEPTTIEAEKEYENLPVDEEENK